MGKRYYREFTLSFYIFRLPGPVLGSGIQGSVSPERTYGLTGALSLPKTEGQINIISAMTEFCAGWKGRYKAGPGWSILSVATEWLDETD